MTRDELQAAVFELEKRALTRDQAAVLAIVSIGRKVRAATFDMLAQRYRDGECDGFTLHMFSEAFTEAHEEAIRDG